MPQQLGLRGRQGPGRPGCPAARRPRPPTRPPAGSVLRRWCDPTRAVRPAARPGSRCAGPTGPATTRSVRRLPGRGGLPPGSCAKGTSGPVVGPDRCGAKPRRPGFSKYPRRLVMPSAVDHLSGSRPGRAGPFGAPGGRTSWACGPGLLGSAWSMAGGMIRPLARHLRGCGWFISPRSRRPGGGRFLGWVGRCLR